MDKNIKGFYLCYAADVLTNALIYFAFVSLQIEICHKFKLAFIFLSQTNNNVGTMPTNRETRYMFGSHINDKGGITVWCCM